MFKYKNMHVNKELVETALGHMDEKNMILYFNKPQYYQYC